MEKKKGLYANMRERNAIKVKHPEFGHVIFHGPTARQTQVLESLKNTCDIVDDIVAQNKMLADVISDKEEEIYRLKQQIFSLKNSGENPYIDLLI